MLLYIIIGLLGLLALLIMWAIGVYNSLVRNRALVDEGFSGIDVQLKRRYDLVPNLVAVVKQYSLHEQNVLENVARMRSVAMNAQTIDQKVDAEKGLTGALKTLFAVAENYPELKANQNFLDLQKELSGLEHEIQLSRRYYNGAARNYNVSVRSFPASLIAQFASFQPVSYFEISADEAKNPEIKF